MSERKIEAVDVILVEFGYYDTEETFDKKSAYFWLPCDLMWSSAGLAQMFEVTRSAWCGSEATDEEGWNTWHLVAIHESDEEKEVDNRIVINVDWVKSHERKR